MTTLSGVRNRPATPLAFRSPSLGPR